VRVLSLPRVDRLLDGLAMWTEDRVRRDAVGYRPAGAGPLACFGPLPALPAVSPPRQGAWSFPSPAVPDDPLTVHVVPARGASRGTAVLVPPWKIRHLRAVAGWSRLVTGAGLDAWIYVPPHHLERARGARSGEGFVTPDLARLRAALEQVVVELRAVISLAGARGPVSLVGLSLGGLAAALAATAPERLAAAALVAPPDLEVSLARTRIGARYRALALRAGAPLPGPEALSAELGPLSPARRSPNAARLLVAGGAHDIIVPPDAPAALARAWGVEPRLYPRGHLSLLLACRALRRDVAALLSAAG
jgi:predicted alpha/beta hydrolase family esterase